MKQLIALSIGLVLAAVVAGFAWRIRSEPSLDAWSQADKAAVIAALAQTVDGGFDAHSDPEVGRLLIPDIEREMGDQGFVKSSSWGLRERELVVPKPEGLLRIVLLGDSLVFGKGAAAEDRMGVVLERALNERAGLRAEVLHIGISGWNLLNSVSFLRRRLDLIDPDLVVHFTTTNDLDDGLGVRGFGGLARFAPELRSRANGRIDHFQPFHDGRSPAFNFLLFAEDHESRTRIAESRSAITGLAELLSSRDVPYVPVMHWMEHTDWIAPKLVEEHLRPSALVVRREFASDRGHWISETDRHWNAVAMQSIGEALYEALRPSIERTAQASLPRWPEAVESLALVFRRLGEPASEPHNIAWLELADSVFDIDGLDDLDGYHVYGGVGNEGLVAPFASLALRVPEDCRRVIVSGQLLGHDSLRDGLLSVYVEDELVGETALGGEGALQASFDWSGPAQGVLANVRLVSSDWVHDADDLQSCISFRLGRLELTAN